MHQRRLKVLQPRTYRAVWAYLIIMTVVSYVALVMHTLYEFKFIE